MVSDRPAAAKVLDYMEANRVGLATCKILAETQSRWPASDLSAGCQGGQVRHPRTNGEVHCWALTSDTSHCKASTKERCLGTISNGDDAACGNQ